MKLTALPLFALVLGLAACGEAEAPTPQSGTTVEEGDDWVAEPEQEGAVDVDLPEAPVEITTPEAEPTPPAE